MSEIISVNPATGEELANLTSNTLDETRAVIKKANSAFNEWSKISVHKRAKYLLRARKYLLKNIDRYARTITLDNGKPLAESLSAEIMPVADLLYQFARNEIKYLEDESLPIGFLRFLRRKSIVRYKPIGVIGIISPWNFPFTIPAGEAAIALLAGNTVVLKTSSLTPLVGKLILEMFENSGLPPGVFNLLIGGADVGEELVRNKIDKLLFTGKR